MICFLSKKSNSWLKRWGQSGANVDGGYCLDISFDGRRLPEAKAADVQLVRRFSSRGNEF